MIHTPKKPPRLIHYASQSAINHTKRETGKFPIVGKLKNKQHICETKWNLSDLIISEMDTILSSHPI